MSMSMTAASMPRLARAMPYPERQVRTRGTVEEHLRAAAAQLPRPPQAFAQLGAARVARLAASHASEVAQCADAPGVAAAALRASLRAGITPAATARSFALIRAVAARQLGLTPYDVQLMAAWSMLRGRMAELATGEGKTLAASLVAATAALAGRMVHVVTVNDYLAARDHALLSPLYQALGLSTGLVVHGQTPAERRAAYACDIVYASNKELVFDYLRDQMRRRTTPTALHGRLARLDGRRADEDALVLRGLDFAIVDEADSVLIDEARTPLIISETASAGVADSACAEALELVAGLVEGADYRIDRSERRIDLTPAGRVRVEALSAAFTARGKISASTETALVLPRVMAETPPCHGRLPGRHGRRRPATHDFFLVRHSKVVGGRPSPAMTRGSPAMPRARTTQPQLVRLFPRGPVALPTRAAAPSEPPAALIGAARWSAPNWW